MTMPIAPVNVVHVAGSDGKCARCGAGLGEYAALNDENGMLTTRPWRPGELVFEYEQINGRSGFADSVMMGRTVDCQP